MYKLKLEQFTSGWLKHTIDTHYKTEYGQGIKDSTPWGFTLGEKALGGSGPYAIVLSGVGTTGCCGAFHVILPMNDSKLLDENWYYQTREKTYSRYKKSECFTDPLLFTWSQLGWRSILMISAPKNPYGEEDIFVYAKEFMEPFFDVEIKQLDDNNYIACIQPKGDDPQKWEESRRAANKALPKYLEEKNK